MRPWITIVAVGSVLLLSAVAGAVGQAASLVGQWNTVSSERGGSTASGNPNEKWVITDTTIKAFLGDVVILGGTYTTNDKATPQRIDIDITESALGSKGKPALGITRAMAPDQLTICLTIGAQSEDRRPSQFSTAQGDPWSCWTLHKSRR